MGLRGVRTPPNGVRFKNRLNVSGECVKIWYFQQKVQKISGKGTAPSPDSCPVGRIPSPTHPPRRLRNLDPSHSKILGTPLDEGPTFKGRGKGQGKERVGEKVRVERGIMEMEGRPGKDGKGREELGPYYCGRGKEGGKE